MGCEGGVNQRETSEGKDPDERKDLEDSARGNFGGEGGLCAILYLL